MSLSVRHLGHFVPFLWKHYLEQKRNLFWTTLELSLQTVFAFILFCLVRFIAPVHHYDNTTTWKSFSISELPTLLRPPSCGANHMKLAYVPNTVAMGRITDDIISRLGPKMDAPGKLVLLHNSGNYLNRNTLRWPHG